MSEPNRNEDALVRMLEEWGLILVGVFQRTYPSG